AVLAPRLVAPSLLVLISHPIMRNMNDYVNVRTTSDFNPQLYREHIRRKNTNTLLGSGHEMLTNLHDQHTHISIPYHIKCECRYNVYMLRIYVVSSFPFKMSISRICSGHRHRYITMRRVRGLRTQPHDIDSYFLTHH